MRILYLDPNFESLTGETGPRSYAFARRLQARGHEVVMLTSDRRFVPEPGERGRIFYRTVRGLPVAVVRAKLETHLSWPRQIWAHLRFAWVCFRFLMGQPRPDVLYVTSPPLSVVIPAMLIRWLRGIPFVLEVRELWPEVPVGMGLLRSRPMIYLLRKLSLTAYRQAERIVALTEASLGHITADIPLQKKVDLIPPCCDINLFDWGEGASIRAEQGWQHKFVCLHIGPMIPATGLEAVLRVADVLREDEQFVFWLIGGGARRAELERQIADRDLHNVIIWDPQPREALPNIMAAADLCLLTHKHYRILEQSSGDRLFDYLAAGRPVLLNYSGWQRELLESHGAGLGTRLGDSGEFYELICRLCDDPGLRLKMSWQARRLAEVAFHPDKWFERFEAVLQEAAGQPVHSTIKPPESSSPLNPTAGD